MPLSAERKTWYFERMKELLTTYTKCFIVEVDNVGSNQLQKTRISLRGKGEVLMGKNTMMRKCIREYVEENPGAPVEALEASCRGNVGFVFTNGDLGEVRTILEENVRPAPAKVSAIAPCDVIVPKGPTGCDPGQTAFFQTLQIGTKIARGQIEIVNDIQLINEGDKVTASQAALLQKLGIEPFTYGLNLKQVYDNGSLFDAKVLDITDDVLAAKFSEALSALAALSLALGFPTQASVPHALLQKLGIEPFTYGLNLKQVYDNGSLFDAKVLDITDDVLAAKFSEALSALAALSLALGFPTQASVPHSIANAFKAVLSVTIGLDNYSFDKADTYKEYLADPSKFASAGGGGGGGGDAGAAEEEKEEEEEEEEADIGGGADMFGGDDGGDY
eukprot:CAMPEP_0197464548 /NCGR_PEP_ID=MMETSP1175-20131217/64077_1 /TAXON_ID=1003142 /ORGANISM="Triceratium dubium, Strain CCMP147" /LENGTH=389 /DNA_ID=CAMNT_0043000529 /DNA_START=118 /DNA_END=1287 /DNA_ORIENTATION=-